MDIRKFFLPLKKKTAGGGSQLKKKKLNDDPNNRSGNAAASAAAQGTENIEASSMDTTNKKCHSSSGGTTRGTSGPLSRNGSNGNNNKKKKKQRPCPQRRKWVKNQMCFVCEEVCEENELEQCQCYKRGNKNFGLIVCASCDDDGIMGCYKCHDRLCFRYCDYTTCQECTLAYCKMCLEKEEEEAATPNYDYGAFKEPTTIFQSCGNCNKFYCQECRKEKEKEWIRRCNFCQKERCTTCKGPTVIKRCEFCTKMVCDDCVDRRFPPEDGRGCRKCADGGLEDLANEYELICKYGKDYEKYDY